MWLRDPRVMFRVLRLRLRGKRLRKALILLSLATVLALTIYVRTFPIKYGAYINEFDPYSYYFCTSVIVDGFQREGFSGLLDFFNYHLDRVWYPYGVDLRAYHPVHPYFGALTYLALKSLGFNVSLYEVAVYLPIAMAALTTLLAVSYTHLTLPTN